MHPLPPGHGRDAPGVERAGGRGGWPRHRGRVRAHSTGGGGLAPPRGFGGRSPVLGQRSDAGLRAGPPCGSSGTASIWPTTRSGPDAPILFEPPRVFPVPLGGGGQMLLQFVPDVLHFAGGHSGPQFSGADSGAFEHYGSSRHDSALSNDGTVHDNGAHSNEGSGLDRASVNNSVVPDAGPIADGEVRLLPGPMQHCPSWMLTRVPSRMAQTSPRTMAPNQMLQSSPVTTSPTTVQLGASQLSWPKRGWCPRTGNTTGQLPHGGSGSVHGAKIGLSPKTGSDPR